MELRINYDGTEDLNSKIKQWFPSLLAKSYFVLLTIIVLVTKRQANQKRLIVLTRVYKLLLPKMGQGALEEMKAVVAMEATEEA